MLLPQLVGLLHGVVVRVAALALHPILSQLALMRFQVGGLSSVPPRCFSSLFPSILYSASVFFLSLFLFILYSSNVWVTTG